MPLPLLPALSLVYSSASYSLPVSLSPSAPVHPIILTHRSPVLCSRVLSTEWPPPGYASTAYWACCHLYLSPPPPSLSFLLSLLLCFVIHFYFYFFYLFPLFFIFVPVLLSFVPLPVLLVLLPAPAPILVPVSVSVPVVVLVLSAVAVIPPFSSFTFHLPPRSSLPPPHLVLNTFLVIKPARLFQGKQ